MSWIMTKPICPEWSGGTVHFSLGGVFTQSSLELLINASASLLGDWVLSTKGVLRYICFFSVLPFSFLEDCLDCSLYINNKIWNISNLVCDIFLRNLFVKVQITEMSWLLLLPLVLICVYCLHCKIRKQDFSSV